MVVGLLLVFCLASLYFRYNFTPVKESAAAEIGKNTMAASTKHMINE